MEKIGADWTGLERRGMDRTGSVGVLYVLTAHENAEWIGMDQTGAERIG